MKHCEITDDPGNINLRRKIKKEKKHHNKTKIGHDRYSIEKPSLTDSGSGYKSYLIQYAPGACASLDATQPLSDQYK